MKVGDNVKHKNLPNENLQVAKISESVAVVNRLDTPKVWYGGRQVMDYQKYICAVENLAVVDKEGQLKML